MTDGVETGIFCWQKILKFIVIMIFLCVPAVLFTQKSMANTKESSDDSDVDFTMFTLEELKNIKITSASKKPETLSEVAAAVFVITKEDIRRSGVTSIPEALRMAPGVQVARVSATEWAVNMRDVNQLFANKLLVLIDGRSVYTHAFSGVFWDIQDTLLEDIERIEVIRGPGAALWGANAVNGVINIITKHSGKTRGGYFSVIGGTEEGIGSLRYGGTLGDEGYYRIYTKFFNRGQLFENDRDIRNDPSKKDWRSGRGGFRMDWQPDKRENEMTFQGEIYSSKFKTEVIRPSLSPPYFSNEQEKSVSSGGHILGRWKHLISDSSDTVFQCFFDHYNKNFEIGNIRADTIDFDFQHRFSPFADNEIIWGLNWRFISDQFEESFYLSTDPLDSDQILYSAFIQDKIQIIPDRLNLTLGAKFEHNEHIGTEVQPSARILLTPREHHEIWSAISRAVRIPSRFERDAVFNEMIYPPSENIQMPKLIRRMGDEDLSAERLIAYEIGYRFQPADGLWLNMSGFYHDYDDLISIQYDRMSYIENGPVPYQVIPVQYENNLKGESYGLEIAAFWQVMDNWQLQGAYTFLEAKMNQSIADSEGSIERIFIDGSNPKNQISVRSALDISRHIELDLWLRYVDRLSKNDVDDYTTLDIKLCWKPTPLLEFSLVGQNLLEKRHSEYSSLEIERSLYFKAEWFF